MRLKTSLLALLLVLCASLTSAQTRTITTTTCPGAGCTVFAVSGNGATGIVISGTFVGTVTFTASGDGSTFATFPMVPIGGGTAASTATAPGFWTQSAGGVRSVRVAFTAYTSGSATIVQTSSTAGGPVSATLTGGGDASAANQATEIALLAGGLPAALGGAGGVKVEIVAGAGAGGTSQADNSAITTITGIGALYDLTIPAITDGFVGLPVMNSARNLLVAFPSAQAIGNVATIGTSVTPGIAAGNLGKAESAAHTSADVGVGVWCVRNDGLTALAANGQYIPCTTDAIGQIQVADLTAQIALLTVAGDTTDIEAAIELLNPKLPTAAAITDNFANPTTTSIMAMTMCWDGSAWDRCAGAATDTELPAAAAITDNFANPTTSSVMAMLMCWDGATWDRCIGGDGTFGSAFPTTGPAIGLSDGTNQVAALATTTQADNLANTLDGMNTTAFNYVYDGSTWDRWTGAVTNGGTFAVQSVEAAGSLLTSSQLIDDDQTGATNDYHISVGTTEDEDEIKATAGRVMYINVTNVNAAARYLKCYNLTAANTTPGTSAVFYGMAVPGQAIGAGYTTTFGPSGMAFSTAFTCSLVTGQADTDVAEVAANEIRWNIGFK